MINKLILCILFIGSVEVSAPLSASIVIKDEINSTLVPGKVKYALLAPTGYQNQKVIKEESHLPLVLNLHGGGGSRDALLRQKEIWDKLWQDKIIPEAIVVTPSVSERSFYMNYRNGNEKWEDFLLLEFIPHIREKYGLTGDHHQLMIMGVSMGGMGALRMAFKHPDMFVAVAALEPGIEPILRWQDMRMKHRFWRADKLFEQAYGKPVDADYWAQNNPATIAVRDTELIKKSGLQIYFEAGDEDQFWLYEGAEFLHQILWQQKIKHEYHLVRGADHVGGSLPERTVEAIKFLFRASNPWQGPPLRVRPVIRWLDGKKQKLLEKDHYADIP